MSGMFDDIVPVTERRIFGDEAIMRDDFDLPEVCSSTLAPCNDGVFCICGMFE